MARAAWPIPRIRGTIDGLNVDVVRSHKNAQWAAMLIKIKPIISKNCISPLDGVINVIEQQIYIII